jgi:hypothetical protein
MPGGGHADLIGSRNWGSRPLKSSLAMGYVLDATSIWPPRCTLQDVHLTGMR